MSDTFASCMHVTMETGVKCVHLLLRAAVDCFTFWICLDVIETRTTTKIMSLSLCILKQGNETDQHALTLGLPLGSRTSIITSLFGE